jgi:nicotinate phosphoribosyltransferase
MSLSALYGHSLALLTDLYQLTMAQGYWKVGAHEKEAAFNLFFRRAPFKGGYAVACGLSTAGELLARYSFTDNDVQYLASIEGNDGKALFDPSFLDFLRTLKLNIDVDAVRDGTLVFPQEPLVRVRGPLLHCQLVETPLLNVVNFQTLIATKASRICQAARGEPVLEFGLRRAHGIDGAISGARAAFVGGCAATSNVLAGRLFDIPVKGTHAHSWVMSFDTELESFQAYAEAMPNNCVFLVDTYDTLEGVRRACEVGRWLRDHGHEMVGIRLDSGELAQLSIAARAILDEQGFPSASIVASNDLDEHAIGALKSEGATIAVWGVGTKLATAYDEPALGGVYKLAAIRSSEDLPWQRKIKLSEQVEKSSNPGLLQIRRFIDGSGGFLRDIIYDTELGIEESPCVVDLVDTTDEITMDQQASGEDLLLPLIRHDELVRAAESLNDAQSRTKAQLEGLSEPSKRLRNAARYPVGLERRLHEVKMDLMQKAREREC